MRRVLVLGALTGVLLAGLAAPAAAAEAEGCAGSAVSTDADGGQYDRVEAPGPGGTKSDPFDVLYDGHVQWEGHTDGVIAPGRWEVTMWPGALLELGDDFENDGHNQANQGDEKVSDRLPFKVTGLFKVDVEITGEGGNCVGGGWVRIADSPLFTPLWFAGTGLGVLGLLLVLFALPKVKPAPIGPSGMTVGEGEVDRHVLRGGLGGLSLGLGLALLAILYGLVAFGTKTPFLILVGALIAGVILPLLPRKVPRPDKSDLMATLRPDIVDAAGDSDTGGGPPPAPETATEHEAPPDEPPKTEGA